MAHATNNNSILLMLILAAAAAAAVVASSDTASADVKMSTSNNDPATTVNYHSNIGHNLDDSASTFSTVWAHNWDMHPNWYYINKLFQC